VLFIFARNLRPSRVRGKLPPGSRAPSIAQTFRFWRSPLAFLEKHERRYGTRFTLYATAHPPLVFLSDPDDIKGLMRAPPAELCPGKGGEMIAPIVGEHSFMLSDGDEHLCGRRTILPAFHSNVISKHRSTVENVIQHELARWPLNHPFALHPYLRRMTLKIILSTIVASADDESLHVLQQRLLAMLDVTASPILAEPQLRHGPGLLAWKSFLRERTEVDKLLYALIDAGEKETPESVDLLTMLLTSRDRDGNLASRTRIRDNLMSIILAGHETTSSQLAWAFQLLAHNQIVQQRLIEEIDHNTGEEYLTATIQEVLRHRPVFLFAIPRAVLHSLEIGGRRFHPPAQLLACIYLLHHNPVLYPRPNEFRPERFLETPPKPHAWLPWGGGRKRCPGLHLAMLEMKTVLRAVLAEMTVHPASRKVEHPRWRSVILTPHAGSRVVLHPRHPRARRQHTHDR
jgi:cytochrome P450